MKKIFLLAALILVIPISAAAKKAPGWITGSSDKYPEPRYFIGVGAVSLEKGGPKQQMGWAADRARAEIAKTIRSHIESTTVAQRAITSERKARPESRSSQTDIVVATANEILEGVEIKEYYKNKKDKMIYALAVLDRPMAADRIQKQMEQLEADLTTELDEAKSYKDTGDLLLAIRHYNMALNIAKDLTGKGELVSVLSPIMEPEAKYEGDIQKTLYDLKKRLRFEVKIEGPASGVRPYIIQGLSQGGFITKGEMETGAQTYLLTGTTDLNYKGEMDMGPDLKVQVYQADLDLEIKNPKTDESIGALTWSVSANEKVETMASKSAVRALGRYVQKTIAERILNAF
jgi:hypothetical protein